MSANLGGVKFKSIPVGTEFFVVGDTTLYVKMPSDLQSGVNPVNAYALANPNHLEHFQDDDLVFVADVDNGIVPVP